MRQAAAEPHHHLVILQPESAVRRVALPPGALTIGRAPPSALLLEGAEVSRTHCRIDVVGDEVSVTDLNSTNGTFVDNKRLSRTAPLRHGALLRIGNYVMTCEYQSVLQAEEADSTQRKTGRFGGVAVLRPRRGQAVIEEQNRKLGVKYPPNFPENLRQEPASSNRDFRRKLAGHPSCFAALRTGIDGRRGTKVPAASPQRRVAQLRAPPVPTRSEIRPPRTRIIGPHWSARRRRSRHARYPDQRMPALSLLRPASLRPRDPRVEQWHQHEHRRR